MKQLQDIIQTVQHNCNIADCHAANDYTLCVYLLKMREYYRWEKKLSFNEKLINSAVGDWISKRELQWHELENSEYAKIEINGTTYSVFESDKINQQLEPHGLIYSGGLNQFHHPHFFIAELKKHTVIDDFHVYITDTEFARELTAPPAMSHNKTIFIRQQSLKRMIWERLEEWQWKKGIGPMSRALDHYDFDHNLDQALEQMTEHETDVLLHHEIGEISAGKHLGEAWHTMLASLPRSKANFMARAVRDHLADCRSTLPMLIKEKRFASIHFYFGNFNAMRKEIFPSLFEAYQRWAENNDETLLIKQIEKGQLHWENIADDIIGLHKTHRKDYMKRISTLVEQNKL
ncbi:MAG: hypothetical protein GXP13_00510 [Gammaproteobacteria bacterium]|nr:hypothetical protein [Gammaproteobacteria bacterium]